MDAVVPVDQGIQDNFADRHHRIFCPVSPFAIFINDRGIADIPSDKCHRSFQHLSQGPFDPLIIDKALSIYAQFPDLCSRHDHRGYTELWEKCLGVFA